MLGFSARTRRSTHMRVDDNRFFRGKERAITRIGEHRKQSFLIIIFERKLLTMQTAPARTHRAVRRFAITGRYSFTSGACNVQSQIAAA